MALHDLEESVHFLSFIRITLKLRKQGELRYYTLK